MVMHRYLGEGRVVFIKDREQLEFCKCIVSSILLIEVTPEGGGVNLDLEKDGRVK